MENSLVSIIIPIYKVEPYIQKCLDSVIKQTYKNIEILLIDDGSPDNCPTICDNYRLLDDRIRAFHKTNGGLSDARNYGIEHAKGDYISFVDSDDFVDKDFINKLYNAITENNADMAMCNLEYVYEDGFNHSIENSPILDEILDRELFFYKLSSANHQYYTVSWNKLYKKSLFDNIKFPYGKLHEDEFIIHRIVNKCEKIVSISDRLYYYLQRSGSIMKSIFDVRRLDAVEAFEDRCRFYLENGYEKLSFYPLKGAYINLFVNHYLPEVYKTDKYKKFKLDYWDLYKKCFSYMPFLYKVCFGFPDITKSVYLFSKKISN